jgi:hypothetical protein
MDGLPDFMRESLFVIFSRAGSPVAPVDKLPWLQPNGLAPGFLEALLPRWVFEFDRRPNVLVLLRV